MAHKLDRLCMEFERYLLTPLIAVQKQAFYGDSDALKAAFVVRLEQTKNNEGFREHLVEVIQRKKLERDEKIRRSASKEKKHNKYEKYSDIYKASNVSKHVFNKIVDFSKNPPHKPQKDTVAALAIGLELNIAEAEEFYEAAGFSLGESDFYDKLIRFCIEHKVYDIYTVSSIAVHFGKEPLGEKGYKST